MKYYSQDGQDKFLIEKIFKFKKKGFFLDIGAYDGVVFSNTYVLEKDLGWEGVCIEPNPNIYKLLSEKRNCITVNCCVSDKIDTVEFLSVNGYGVMLSGILKYLDGRHLQRIDDIINEHGGTKEVIRLPALTIQHILEKNNISSIDYCNIDVEGGEYSILKTLDFSKTDIKLFSIENNNNSKVIYELLKPHGYSLIAKIGADEIYEKNSKRYLMMLNLRLANLKRYVSKFKRSLIN